MFGAWVAPSKLSHDCLRLQNSINDDDGVKLTFPALRYRSRALGTVESTWMGGLRSEVHDVQTGLPCAQD